MVSPTIKWNGIRAVEPGGGKFSPTPTSFLLPVLVDFKAKSVCTINIKHFLSHPPDFQTFLHLYMKLYPFCWVAKRSRPYPLKDDVEYLFRDSMYVLCPMSYVHLTLKKKTNLKWQYIQNFSLIFLKALSYWAFQI